MHQIENMNEKTKTVIKDEMKSGSVFFFRKQKRKKNKFQSNFYQFNNAFSTRFSRITKKRHQKQIFKTFLLNPFDKFPINYTHSHFRAYTIKLHHLPHPNVFSFLIIINIYHMFKFNIRLCIYKMRPFSIT